MRGYFDKHAFQSITTETFVEYLQKNLIDTNPKLISRADVDEWIYKAGLPKNAPVPQSDAFQKVETEAQNYASGKLAASAIQTNSVDDAGMAAFLENSADGFERGKNGGARPRV